jgi:glycerate 2-kinase
MRVVIAPDSFKGSISAAGAAAALAAGWRLVRPADEVVELPLADGGEGTLAVLAAAVPASRRHPAEVSGPGTATVQAAWLEMPGNVAVIELATAAGLTQLAELQPLAAHSYGVGELIGLALDAGARQVLVALGGSASTDGGTGALTALGGRFLDETGMPLTLGGGALRRLASVDLAGLRAAPPVGVSCLTDVRAPLLGPDGAAAVFGPQKGAAPADVAVLEAGLARLAALLGGDPDAPGAGAAGGCGYGLAAAWHAKLLPGAAELAAIAGLPQALANADLVITGEGRYDGTSLTGKVVGAVCAMAASATTGSAGTGTATTGTATTGSAGTGSASTGPTVHEVPVAIVAGQLALAPPPGARAVELAALAGGADVAVGDPARWLAAAGAELAGAS